MSTLTLSFDIQSTWHIGSGEEGGAYADSLALKNGDNLPFIPGRAVKGLLRDAFKQAEENGWFTKPENIENLTHYIFGSEGQNLSDQGIVHVTSAELSPQEQAYFIATDKAAESTSAMGKASSELYQVLFSTAIDHKTGSAKQESLRSIEVALPMLLETQVTMSNNPEKTAFTAQQVLEWLAQASTLITGIGAKRKRGLGQVVVTGKVGK